MARTPRSSEDDDDAHETNEHDDADGRQTRRCRWMTTTTKMKNSEHDDEQKRRTATSIVVVYSVRKDPPPPFVFLTPILVATSPTATFGNQTTHSSFIIVLYFTIHTLCSTSFVFFFSLNQVPCRWKRHGTQTTNDASFVIVNIIC